MLTLKLVAMAKYLERSEKRVKSVIYDQVPTMVQNMVKTGSVDPDIICLKCLF